MCCSVQQSGERRRSRLALAVTYVSHFGGLQWSAKRWRWEFKSGAIVVMVLFTVMEDWSVRLADGVAAFAVMWMSCRSVVLKREPSELLLHCHEKVFAPILISDYLCFCHTSTSQSNKHINKDILIKYKMQFCDDEMMILLRETLFKATADRKRTQSFARNTSWWCLRLWGKYSVDWRDRM